MDFPILLEQANNEEPLTALKIESENISLLLFSSLYFFNIKLIVTTKEVQSDPFRLLFRFSFLGFCHYIANITTLRKGNSDERLRYAKLHKDWNQPKSFGVMNPNVTLLVQIVTNAYRGDQQRGTTVSVYGHL